MRRQFITALAGFVVIAASYASVSAHGRYSRPYMEDWYKAYDRYKEAEDRRRANEEARVYERAMAHQRYLTRERDRAERYSEVNERRWADEAHRRYRDYERYCDCSPYREYADGPRVYGYSYANSYSHYPHSYTHYPHAQLNDRLWKPDDYPTGWSAWWLRMEREGRAGRN